jgi:hypothetical protein
MAEVMHIRIAQVHADGARTVFALHRRQALAG